MASVARRLDQLEEVLGAMDDADSVIVERDPKGRIEKIAMRFAYQFDAAGAVIGIKVGKLVHTRRPDEPLWEFRRRVVAPSASVWKELLAQVLPSRGLPAKDDGFDAARERTEARRADVAADAVRRKGETEWGERVIGLVELFEANDR
jgi:hypothetical protein